MITAIFFDTLAYANRLREVGVPEKQAKVQVEMLAEVIENNLATKQDITSVKQDIKSLKKDLESNLEIRLAQLKNELIKWVFGFFIAQAAIIISCSKLIH